MIFGCSSIPNNVKISSVNINSSAHSSQITLSHVKAYLLLGNIKKAEQLFETIEVPELNAQAMLTLAELHAAKGNSVDAQQVFLLALTDDQFVVPINKTTIPTDLLDYFCVEKKWPALQGYGAAILTSASDDNAQLTYNTLINKALTKIGLCFFQAQRWNDAKHWLEKIDYNLQVTPLTYLALARSNIELQLYSDAQRLITRYESTKDNVDAKTLWTTIEVYIALKQPEMVIQTGENMRSLFPFNQYTRNYILLTKRGRIQALVNNALAASTTSSTAPKFVQPSDSLDAEHVIKKGETLYQLTQKYKVSVAQLLLWNANLAINKISIGTRIKLGPEQN